MIVEYEETKLTDEEIIKAVEQGGYGAKVHGKEKQIFLLKILHSLK